MCIKPVKFYSGAIWLRKKIWIILRIINRFPLIQQRIELRSDNNKKVAGCDEYFGGASEFLLPTLEFILEA